MIYCGDIYNIYNTQNTVTAVPPIYMAGPMTGPGQVPWDSDLGVPLIWNEGTTSYTITTTHSI